VLGGRQVCYQIIMKYKKYEAVTYFVMAFSMFLILVIWLLDCN